MPGVVGCANPKVPHKPSQAPTLGVVTIVAHAGDAQLYLLVMGVVFVAAYRLVRGPLPDVAKRRSPRQPIGQTKPG
jgi:hypothetical protein